MTTEEFVTMIWKQLKEEEGLVPFSQQLLSLSDYGHRRGWLEDQDVTDWKTGMKRMTAARIVHEFLNKERHEADEGNWQGAENLKDLYDCHTCVNHVAQVYAKGIMEPVGGGQLFGMRLELTSEEAEAIVSRIFSKDKRRIPKATNSRQNMAVRFSLQEALIHLSEEEKAMLIDVRTPREYEEKHLPGAILIPMTEIIKNPHGITDDRGKALYFYCGQGYQSEIAANCVAEAGYEKVFYFGLTEF